MNTGRLTFLKVTYVCCTVSDDDVKVILDLKCAFEKPFAEVRKQLQSMSPCSSLLYIVDIIIY